MGADQTHPHDAPQRSVLLRLPAAAPAPVPLLQACAAPLRTEAVELPADIQRHTGMLPRSPGDGGASGVPAAESPPGASSSKLLRARQGRGGATGVGGWGGGRGRFPGRRIHCLGCAERGGEALCQC